MSNKTKIRRDCRRVGHEVNAVIVETTSGFRNLSYCICCGERLKLNKIWEVSTRLEGLSRKSKISRSRRSSTDEMTLSPFQDHIADDIFH